MNKALFSIFKSILNSFYYNGFLKSFGIIISLALIKLNFKKNISVKNSKLILRNGTSDLPVFRQVFMDYEYLLSLNANSIKTIIDGGCNVGMASVYFASVFPYARIIGVEPDDHNYAQAVLNTATLKNCTVIKAGIWNKNCFLETQSDKNFGEWGITVKEISQERKDSIKAMTIDSIMNEYNFETIDILKLDIEGAEFEVFQSGFESWLPKTKTIVIELHDFMKKNCSATFFNALAKTGMKYSLSLRGENIVVELLKG